MERVSPKWNEYNAWNERHVGMSMLWVEKLRDWILANRDRLCATHVLDYGCGYFDLGRDLQPHFEGVDGYDPNPRDLKMAEVVAQAGKTEFFAERSSLPRGKYDLLVLNSVVQYFEGDPGLEEFFAEARELLKGRGSKVILSDLIPMSYRAPLDAFRSLWEASKRGFTVPMVKHLAKAALKSDDFRLYQVDFARVREIAGRHGFHAEKLPRNLTPSRQRYSVLLTLNQP